MTILMEDLRVSSVAVLDPGVYQRSALRSLLPADFYEELVEDGVIVEIP